MLQWGAQAVEEKSLAAGCGITEGDGARCSVMMLGRLLEVTAMSAQPERSGEGDMDLPVDLEALMGRCLGDCSFALRLIDRLDRSLKSLSFEVSEGDAAGDVERVRHAAGAIRNVAEGAGAVRLREAAASLATLAGTDDAATRFRVGELSQEINRLRLLLPEVRARMGGG